MTLLATPKQHSINSAQNRANRVVVSGILDKGHTEHIS